MMTALYEELTLVPNRLNEGNSAGFGYWRGAALSLFTSRPMRTRNCDRPRVTMVPSTRGAFEMRRRTNPSSIPPEIRPPAMTATGNATQYGSPAFATRTPSTEAPNTPTAALAKLMNLLARYTSTRPTASRP